MTTNEYSFQSSSTNSTAYDYFCTGKLTGPLIWSITSMIFASFGVPICVWLLWVLVQKHCRSRSTSNMYLLNLTFIDLIFNLTMLPMVLNYFVSRDLTFLRIGLFFCIFIVSARPLLMSCVCIDSYLAVVHPIIYMQIKNGSYRLFTSALVWVSSVVLNVFFVTHLDSLILTTPLAVSAPVIAFCDISIISTLKRSDPFGRSDVHPQKQRAVQTVINSLIVSLLCQPPLLIFYAIPNTPDMFCNIGYPVFIMISLGSTIIPLLYLENLGKLKCKNHQIATNEV